MLIIGPKLESLNIKIIHTIEEFEIKNYDNALIQVLVNILNNANDALIENNPIKKVIFMEMKKENDSAIIKIKDNAKGINKTIIDKVFDPYFTTKFKSKGTGIGLYMTEELVSKHIKGKISVYNDSFEYLGEEQKGAEFKITLPLSI